MPSFLESCLKYVFAPFDYRQPQSTEYLAAERYECKDVFIVEYSCFR